VKVPVAAPRLPLEETSAPNVDSVRPLTAGNWLRCGRSAAASSLTAGGWIAVVWVAPVVPDGLEADVAECELEDPHPATTSARATRAGSARVVRIRCLIVLLVGFGPKEGIQTGSGYSDRRRVV
jgi:hypothetical protein